MTSLRVRRDQAQSIVVVVALLALSLVMPGCRIPGTAASGSTFQYVATIPPMGMVLREVVGERGAVDVLLPSGASAHTFEPRPSDARRAAGAAVFHVGRDLDAWAARLPARAHIAVLDLLPESSRRPFPGRGDEHGHEHGGMDPHFWTDPLTVRALLPALAEELGRLDPEGRAVYRGNAERFASDLQSLHEELAETLRPVCGRRVALFHPSFHYLFHRYGIVASAVLEPAPGKEPTARYVKEVIATLRETEASAVFTEPQLPRRPAEVVAEATRLPLGELDPLGGGPGRTTYADLMRYNAKEIRRAVR